MSSTARALRSTPAEYLARERPSATRHEYRDGYRIEKAGASRAHNLITGNLGSEISSQLRDRPCEVYISDMRVCIEPTGLYTYPDVVVVCGEPRFQDNELDTLLNPTVLVEVLSPSTEAYDRGLKFGHYRRLATLREYVLVSQDRVLVERFIRQGEEWLLAELNRPEDVLRLASIGCEVPLREIYAKVEFADAERTTASR
jgi:Uma2 family endonuclease